MVACPACEEDLGIAAATMAVGALVICGECGVELKVVKARPLTLAEASADDDWGETE